ncbi:hypothetical protein [Erwinia sp.]|uniref:hypothetical protein n=1 Tax=Erwinia citreus TaxID=558 RepID=UPI0028A1D5D2|nr:hypothetical protein [Erwinia sp.]
MNTNQHVIDALFNALLVENTQRYREALLRPVDGKRDVYGQARNALSALEANEKEAVLRFINLAVADSVSIVLGTLDGSFFPEGISGDFVVNYDGSEIQGDLQDLFLEKAQDAGVFR